MRRTLLLPLLATALHPAATAVERATGEDIEKAWLAFSSARGDESLILGDTEHPSANAVFRVIPDVTADTLDEDKLQLGFDLFQERRLSKDGTIACTSCHIGMLGGVDRRPVSFGIGGAEGTLNAPTIFNAALNFRQFWDGRALTLQEQALGPIENPIEFGHDLDGAVAALQAVPDYVSAFNDLYPDGITAANLSDAIAYYETMNFTGLDSPFLRQFRGEGEGLSRQALRGQQRFMEVGCASCHNGINLGGNSYQQLGVAEPWYSADRPAREQDDGLFGRSEREQDRHVFKVPTLHNVAITGPWLHDGSITSLHQAVDRMARHQSGRYLENEDIDDIVAFLRALGDSLGMIGDCAVSGNYAVTMECDVSQRSADPANDATPSSAPRDVALPAPVQLSQQHQLEYEAALQRVTEAPERIAHEIQRIRSAEVAHYDFLQYEHLEMLRHALALAHPPAGTEPEQRNMLLSQASQWLRQAQEYELVIADFLRAQAVADNAKANYQDLLRLFSVEADEKITSLLAHADRSMLAYYTQPGPGTRLQLEDATEALEELDLDPDRFAELRLQARMLVAVNEMRVGG